jgi:hypothetical protein
MTGHIGQDTDFLENTVDARVAAHPAWVGLSAAMNPPRVLSPADKLPDCRRILVLVPTTDTFQDSPFSQRIWQLAAPGKVAVHYITIAEDYQTEMTAHRHLTLLAAITRDKHVRVETHVVHAANWVSALKSIMQPGDLILAQAEQRIPKGLFGSQLLSAVLGTRIAAPLCLLSGYCQESPAQTSKTVHRIVSALFLGLILVGFFALDKQTIDQLSGSLQQVMLLLWLVLEVGAIWVWNGWTG